MPPALWLSSKALTAVFFLSISISGGEAAYWSDEKSWKKLDEGRDPECSIKKDGRDCTLKSVSAVTGTACSQHEQRCFVPSNNKDGDHRMFSAPREKDRPYLFAPGRTRVSSRVSGCSPSDMSAQGVMTPSTPLCPGSSGTWTASRTRPSRTPRTATASLPRRIYGSCCDRVRFG